MEKQLAIVLDFGGQYSHLIARRVRELGVYCEVMPFTKSVEQLVKMGPLGIILTGGPNSVYAEGSPLCSPELFEAGIPILGICYGAQLTAYLNGGSVTTPVKGEYGGITLNISDTGSPLLN
ncbi:MAG: GMP synthase (glutamine-hydrolyzing), partial [Eubacteriales bacterium]